MADRISTIQSMLKKSPGDVFLRYSLAMEFFARGDHEQAIQEFSRCIQEDPAYLPAYVEAGKCLRAAGRIQQAIDMFKDGLRLAQTKGDRHTQDFIAQQLEGLVA